MRPATRLELVDALAALASTAEPPPLDEAAARRMIDRAVDAAPRRAATPRRSRVPFVAAAGAFALAAACVLLVMRPAPEPPPIRLALPTGDHLVGTAGARFELTRVEAADRRVHLLEGAMLFDVAHVVRGQHFAVTAGEIEVVATGTVFSVDTRGPSVHVYEGRVEVHAGGEVVPVSAGASWGTGADAAELIAAGDEAAEQRRSDGTTERTNATPRPRPPQDSSASGATDPPHAIDSSGHAADPHAPDAAHATDAARVAHATDAADATDTGHATDHAADPQRTTPSGHPADPRRAADAAHATNPRRASDASRGPTGSAHRADSIATDASKAPDGESIPSPESHAPTPDERLAQARADLAAGHFDDALAKVAGAASGPALLVKGDALRALERWADAATAYDNAAGKLAGVERAEATYTAAYIRFHDLHDAQAALATLGDLDAPGAPLEERALGLRVRLLVAVKDPSAKDAAVRYLTRFPDGDLHSYMRSLTN